MCAISWQEDITDSKQIEVKADNMQLKNFDDQTLIQAGGRYAHNKAHTS